MVPPGLVENAEVLAGDERVHNPNEEKDDQDRSDLPTG